MLDGHSSLSLHLDKMDLIDQILSIDRSSKSKLAWIFWGRSRLQLLRSLSKQYDISDTLKSELRYEAYHAGLQVPSKLPDNEVWPSLVKLYAEEALEWQPSKNKLTIAEQLVHQLRRKMIEASVVEVSKMVIASNEIHKYKIPLAPFGWLHFSIHGTVAETALIEYLQLCRARARLKYAFLHIMPSDGLRWEMVSTQSEVELILNAVDLRSLLDTIVEKNETKLSNKLIAFLRDRLAIMNLSISDLPSDSKIETALNLLRLND